MRARCRWNVAAAMAKVMMAACGTTSEEEGVARYEVADERLTLHAADGSTLVYERAEEAP